MDLQAGLFTCTVREPGDKARMLIVRSACLTIRLGLTCVLCVLCVHVFEFEDRK